MNCNQCKNPVNDASIFCEWCGAKVERTNVVTENAQESEKKHPSEQLLIKLLEIENEIIEASGNKSPFASIIKGGEDVFKGDAKGLKDIAIGAGDLATGGILGTVTSFLTKPGQLKAIAEKKAVIIATYPLPSNAEHLLEMANLAVSSFNQIKLEWGGSGNEHERKEILKNAWKAKAEQAVEKLELFAQKDDFIKGKVAELKLKINPKKNYKTIIIFGSIAFVILTLIIANGIFGNGDEIAKQKTEKIASEKALDTELTQIEDDIKIAISKGEKEKAFELIKKLHHNSESISPYVKKESMWDGTVYYTFKEYWDFKRDSYIKQVQ